MSIKAETIIRPMRDVFELATTGFEEFYQNANNKSNETSSKSATSGGFSMSATSGDYSESATSGGFSKSASSGNYSKSVCAGQRSAASALGYRAAVRGELGSLLMCSEFVEKNDIFIPVGGKADLVDGQSLKPNCWYIVENGKWVEVDFTDNIFSYVLTTKNGVKKVRLEDGTINYIVYDEEGNAAHGDSIKEARKDLIYKKTVSFDGIIPKSATGETWIGLYRAITGACSSGIRAFVESKKLDLTKSYTAKEVCEISVGQYGAESFSKKVKELVKEG